MANDAEQDVDAIHIQRILVMVATIDDWSLNGENASICNRFAGKKVPKVGEVGKVDLVAHCAEFRKNTVGIEWLVLLGKKESSLRWGCRNEGIAMGVAVDGDEMTWLLVIG